MEGKKGERCKRGRGKGGRRKVVGGKGGRKSCQKIPPENFEHSIFSKCHTTKILKMP